jgi:hypothetical protein
LPAEADSSDPGASRKEAAESLREIVATVGKPGLPGEQVRCVVSVQMLTEGWDANNVTHILGLRAFGSQLLCEQVVGRGLRRMDYTVDPTTGLLTEEYVDVYGIPFSVIPFKGRQTNKPAPEDKPVNHVRALDERRHFEIRFPVVESFAFALRRNLIKADIDKRLIDAIEPDDEKGEAPLLPILNRYKPVGSTGEVNFKTTKPCFLTALSHINQVAGDTQTWEQSAAFRLELARVVYAKNDHLEFAIPYEYLGVRHAYIPDFLVRLEAGVTLILEIKGYLDDQDLAKHQAAKRWCAAVNNWGQLGRWRFHVCRDPQLLERELAWLRKQAAGAAMAAP